MFLRLLTAAALCLVICGPTGAGDDKTRDNLEGTWQVTKVIDQAKAVEDFKATHGAKVEIKGNKVTFYGADNKQLGQATYKLLEAGKDDKGRGIDLKFEEGPRKGTTSEGYFVLQGDTLRVMYPTGENAKRPTALTPLEAFKEGVIMELKRDKK